MSEGPTFKNHLHTLCNRYPHVARPLRPVVPWLYDWEARHAWRELEEQQNWSTKVPETERVEVVAIWVVELYTPATIDDLLQKLRDRQHARTPAELDNRLAEQILRLRVNGLGGGGQRVFHGVDPAPAPLPPGVPARLPKSFDWIDVWFLGVSSTITAMVAMFLPSPVAALSLDRALRRDYRTYSYWSEGGIGTRPPFHAKQEAVRMARVELRKEASSWIANHMPGVFSAGLLNGLMPSCELIATKEGEPRDQDYDPSWAPDYIDAAGLSTQLGWTHLRAPSLRLQLPLGTPYLGEDYSIRLASREQDLIDHFSRRQSSTADAAIWLRRPIQELLTRWSICLLLEGWQQRLAKIRDLAKLNVTRNNAIQQLDQMRADVLTAGIDVAICSEDIRGILQLPQWSGSGTIDDDFVSRSDSEHSLLEELSSRVQQQLDPTVESAERLRRVIDMTGNLIAARSNLLLQRWAVILACLSTIVAITAIIIASIQH